MKIATNTQQASQEAQSHKSPSRLPAPSVFTNKSQAAATDDLQDSPRTHIGPAKRRPAVLKNIDMIAVTLRAQKLAGKTDSAEMYKGAFSPTAPTSRHASPASSPRSSQPSPHASPASSPRSPVARRTLAEQVALLNGLSDEEVSSDLSDEDVAFGASDRETLNTGWNEWGIDVSSDDESAKPKSSRQTAADKADGHTAKSPGRDIDFGCWNEWALSDSEAE